MEMAEKRRWKDLVLLVMKEEIMRVMEKLWIYSGKNATGRTFHCGIAGDLHFFYYTLSFGDDLICVQNWMGMVSFLSSPVVGTFWSKKVKKICSERCPF